MRDFRLTWQSVAQGTLAGTRSWKSSFPLQHSTWAFPLSGVSCIWRPSVHCAPGNLQSSWWDQSWAQWFQCQQGINCQTVVKDSASLHKVQSFSSAAGALDGCHICIKPPGNLHQAVFINYKLFPSIQMQAICNTTGRLSYLWDTQGLYVTQGSRGIAPSLARHYIHRPAFSFWQMGDIHACKNPSPWSHPTSSLYEDGLRGTIITIQGFAQWLNVILGWWKHDGGPHVSRHWRSVQPLLQISLIVVPSYTICASRLLTSRS